jgi:hypothetical protein
MKNKNAIATGVTREGPEMSPQELQTSLTSTGSWDPYDVWLTRVKQPRDQHPRRPEILETILESPDELHAGDTNAADSGLLPGVS